MEHRLRSFGIDHSALSASTEDRHCTVAAAVIRSPRLTGTDPREDPISHT